MTAKTKKIAVIGGLAALGYILYTRSKGAGGKTLVANQAVLQQAVAAARPTAGTLSGTSLDGTVFEALGAHGSLS